jgi:hypothetical protein
MSEANGGTQLIDVLGLLAGNFYRIETEQMMSHSHKCKMMDGIYDVYFSNAGKSSGCC